MVKLNPKKTMFILFLIIILGISANLFLIFFANKKINQKVEKINQSALKVKNSENKGKKLNSIKRQLNEINDISKKLDDVSTIEEKNIYQEDTINKIKELTAKSGLKLKTINFNNFLYGQNINVANLVLSFESPVNYRDLMNFIVLTENSLPRMQITNISITSLNNSAQSNNSNQANKGKVNVSSIGIKIYVR